jgi:hypothetical protein
MEEKRLQALKNGALMRIFGPSSADVTADWRKLHNEEFSFFNSLPIIRATNTWRTRKVVFKACMRRKKNTVYRVWCKPLKERCPLEDLVVDVRIQIETVLNRTGQEG